MDYWTRFAAYGDPNGSGELARWLRYGPSDAIQQLDESPVRIRGYHNEQCDFLSTLPQP